MAASHFELPPEAAAAIAAAPAELAPVLTPASPPAPVAPSRSDPMSQIEAAELDIVAAAIAAAELRAAAGVPAPSAIFVEERNNAAMLEGPTIPRRPKRNRTKLYVMMAMCAALVVAGAGIVMFRVIPKNRAAPQPATAPVSAPVSAPVVPSAAPAAAPITDSMEGGQPATVTDTVALMGAAPMQRLPVGPAAMPAAYAGRGGKAVRAGAPTVAPANPAAVYSPGAAPAISTSQPTAAVAAPKVATPVKAPPKTAAELRASAAFRGQLTPEAAAEMAAVRSEISAKKQRDDSIKRAADSAGAR
jgi:hypothetical protein